MRRVLLVILLMISAVIPAGRAATAGTSKASITLIGNRTGYVDITLDEKTKLDSRDTKIDLGGDVGGWIIHPLDRHAEYWENDYAGAYMLREVGPTDESYGPHMFLVTATYFQILPPGRYRIYLLADGPTRVRIPLLKGKTSAVLRPAKRSGVRWTTEDFPMAVPGTVAQSVSQPFHVAGDWFTFSSLYMYAEEGATAQNTSACLRDDPDEAIPPEQNCEGGGIVGYLIHAQQDYAFSMSMVYPPGSVETGNYFTFANARATKVDRVVGVGITIEMRGVR